MSGNPLVNEALGHVLSEIARKRDVPRPSLSEQQHKIHMAEFRRHRRNARRLRNWISMGLMGVEYYRAIAEQIDLAIAARARARTSA